MDSIRKAAKQELDRDLKIILIPAKILRILTDEIRSWKIEHLDHLDAGIDIKNYIDWSNIITPQIRECKITEDQLSTMINIAKEKVERQLGRMRVD